jgi:endonuclease/exonuclease/phosphatase (EEP) superfamily protein YafD
MIARLLFSANTPLRFLLWGLTLTFLATTTGVVSMGTLWHTTAAPLYAQPDGGTQLRVMSWNALFLNQNPAAFQAALVELDPDLIAIQEIGAPLVAELVTQWQSIYPYMELYPTGSPAGMAIVSRYPFLTTTVPDFAEQSGCNCQIVTIDIAGTAITLISAHPWPPEIELTKPTHWSNLLGLNTANQDPTFDQLLARIAQTSGPLLVMGDLNTMPFQPNVQRLQAILTDAFVAAGSGLGYTFPADGSAYGLPSYPFMRIDYIFYNAAWRAEQTWVGTIEGSDHCYVAADLLLE